MHFRIVRRQLRENATEPQCILAQGGPHHVVAGRGGVTLVEDQIEHFQYCGESRCALRGARHFERDLIPATA